MATKIAGLAEGLGPIAVGGSPRTGRDTRPAPSWTWQDVLSGAGDAASAVNDFLYTYSGGDYFDKTRGRMREALEENFPKVAGAMEKTADVLGKGAEYDTTSLLPGVGGLGMFIGKRAKLTKPMKEALEEAGAMRKAGRSMKVIRQRTGWDLSPDGSWRYEISDKPMKLTPYGESMADTPSRYTPEHKPDKLPKLGKQIDHPELYEMYPELADTPALIQRDSTQQGAFYPPNAKHGPALEAFGPRYDANDIRSLTKSNLLDTTAHEIQHAIQYLEGRGHGANPDEIPSVVRQYFPHDDDMSRYLRNGAENEATATARRRTMGMDERLALNPTNDYNFSPSGQWDWFDSGKITADEGRTVLRRASPKYAGSGGRLEPSSGLTDRSGMPSRDMGGTTPPGKISGLGGDGRVLKSTDNKGPRMRPDLEKFPELENRYPVVKEGVWKTDKKTGKVYLGKDLSEEALRVDKVRKKIAEEVAKREYKPFFDPKKRQRVDPTNYPKAARTQDVTYPKKRATVEKYEALANDPAAEARLEAGFKEASKFKDSGTWYYMKQLEDLFIDEHGPELGRKEFESWARAMAETTGGADPQTNFLAAQYLLHRRGMGLDAPTAQPDMPYPVGGRFMSGNMEIANRQAGEPFDPALNPKRHNFEANFEGHPDPTIDEVMMTQGFGDPKGAPEYYGPYEKKVSDLAEKHGVPGDEFQDKAWQGLKRIAEMKRGDVPSIPAPMIQIVNDSIERTARLIGKSPEYVARKMLVHRKPMYGITGLLLGAGALGAMDGYEEPVI